MNAASRRGIQRERQVRDHLRLEGWLVVRAAGSIGCADLIAIRSGQRPRLIEVKSTAGGPYEKFGPKERAELLDAAAEADAVPLLCWWPLRKKLRFIPASEWPGR